MNTLVDKPQKATYPEGRVYVSMASGLDFSFPSRAIPGSKKNPNASFLTSRSPPLASIGQIWMKICPFAEFLLEITGSGTFGLRKRLAPFDNKTRARALVLAGE